ncbi:MULTISPECIES: SH3 domain-containing protein [unclassified Sphingomonas]|uniref:SH3 domain-containing protein n=1 Tax=unclassified Sphingomonas TaxID=196159 RepID=UPI0008351130|nr:MULTISPECIES: SH3 domain-containing protein [unclassified Sphingomonas]
MARRFPWRLLTILLVLPGIGGAADAQRRKTPYFASIAADRAMMRTGPGRNYPAIWLYRRDNLPIRVVDIYKDWRKIEDPDGTQGWMLVNLLSSQRTGVVIGGVTPMRATPGPGAKINWRAAPGVVGKLDECRAGWCLFDVRGRTGYIEQASLWGVDPGEEF